VLCVLSTHWKITEPSDEPMSVSNVEHWLAQVLECLEKGSSIVVS